MIRLFYCISMLFFCGVTCQIDTTASDVNSEITTQTDVPDDVDSDGSTPEALDDSSTTNESAIDVNQNSASVPNAVVDENTDISQPPSEQSSESSSQMTDSDSEYLLDAVRAVVITPEGTEVVVQSDLDRPSLTGQILTLDDRVAECCFYLDAVKQKAVATEDQIDRYLSSIQRDNNITLDDLKQSFAAGGLTYSQAREQLGRLQTVNTIVELRVMSNVVISRKEVLAYYEQHAPMREATYFLQRAVVPFEYDRAAQRAHLIKMISTGEDNGGLRWSMIFSLSESEIAQDKDFIHQAMINQMLFGGESDEGFELYRVVDKKEAQVIPLEECYAYIERSLKQPLYEKLMKEYKEKLFEKMTIVYV